jgi:plasmid stabilization system protein ParE
MTSVIVLDRAEAEMTLSYAWYEDERPGLGEEFLQAVNTAFTSIRDNPNLCPFVHRQIRRALVHRFPFAVFYVVRGANVIVLHVLHTSRSPSRWRT